MSRRILTLSILCVALAATGVAVWKLRRPAGAQVDLLSRLPTQNATVLSVDFDRLRSAGLLSVLAASKTAEEPEYLSFVRDSGFDYKHDLDSALVAFSPDGTYFLIRGRFQWKQLQEYARQQGGSCYDQLCRMPGSTPDKRISFLPLSDGVMALAVSHDDLAASRLLKPVVQRPIEAPQQPMWVSVPAASLRRGDLLPAGARLLASAMVEAERVTFTMGPEGMGLEARLEAVCQSTADAKLLAGQLEKATALLREAAAHQPRKPGPADFTSVLTAGVFTQSDRKVLGRWQLQRSFLESLMGGI